MNRRITPVLAAFGTGLVLLVLVAAGVYLLLIQGMTKRTSDPAQSVALSGDTAVRQPGEKHIIGGDLGVTGGLNTSSLQVTGSSSLQDVSVAGQLKATTLGLTSADDQSTSGTLYVATDGSLNYTAAGATLNISQAASRQIPTVTPSVLSLQGQTGNISLAAGTGVAINGTTISNTGVTSFGGQSGAITIGSGLSLSGNTLSNTGIQSVSSLSANIIVATDSHGNLTIQDAGTGSGGTVSLAPATAQTDASNFASIAVNKTGTGNLIQLSTGVSAVNRFVVDQTGAITSGSISFSQVTSTPSIVNSIDGASGALALGSGLGRSGQNLINTGVTSLGGTGGAITLGNGLTISGGQLSTTGSGIASVTGTPNQVIVSGTGNLTLSLPQSIATSSSPTFAGLTLTGGLSGATGSFTGAVSGANATTNTQFTTLGQVNSLIAASGAGSGVNSLNGQTGALSIQGNGQITVDATTSPNIKLSIQGDSIGNAQLAYDTGQNLTTTSTPTFAALTVNGGGVFTGTVSGAAAVSGSDFVTKNQLNTAVGSIGGGSVIGGSGVANKLAMFTGANTVGDSILTQSDANSDGTPDTITVTGTLAATKLQGDGSGVANVDAVTLQGHAASYFTNADNLASGTVASARITGNYTGITGLGTITSGTWNGTVVTDPYVADNLTISSGGSVDWSALDNYPAACSAGQAITTLGDTPTCQTFLTVSSADGSYVQLQPTTSGAAQTGNLKVTGTAAAGSVQGGTGSFTGTVSGADATASNQFATLGQVNGLITASGAGAGVNSLNGLAGSVTLQGNSQIAINTTSPNISLSIQGDSIGDAQLAYNTGQNLTTTSTPTFAGVTLTGNLAGTSGSFSSTVSGANATANNQFVTLAQLNTAIGGVGSGVTTVGALDGGTANAKGATISGSTVYLQSASATMPGLVNTTTQTFAGNKTFSGNMSVGGSYDQSASTGTFKTGSGAVSLGGDTTIASGKALTAQGTVTFQNSTDSTSAVNVNTSTGASVLKVDTTNGFVGINNNSPAAPLDVVGVGPSYTDGFESGALGPFTTPDATKWAVVNTAAHAGSYALVGNYNHDSTNSTDYTVSVTQTLSAAGTISFYYNCDNPWFTSQSFKIDSGSWQSLPSSAGICSGLSDASAYALASYGVSGGTHTFTWLYNVGSKGVASMYTLRIDDIKITNVGTAGTAALFNGGGVGINLGLGVQPAAALDVNGTINSSTALTVGKANTTTGTISIANSTNANQVIVTSAAQSGNYSATIPVLAANDTFCMQLLANCTPATGAFIQNQNATQQASGNYWIDGTGRADTSLLTPTVDTATAAALNLGTTNATIINLNQNTTLAAGKSFTITGGATGTRPASPTKGQIYYDTTTNTLLTWNGTKWMSDQKTANKIVAMGTATGCTGTSPVASSNPDGADYVVTSCTSAQTTIAAAIAALPASGGTIYLEDGTYIIDGTLTIPSNVTIAGDGDATTLKPKDSASGTVFYIPNGSNGVTIQNLRVDGNAANQTNLTDNIRISSTGSPGTLVDNVTSTNAKQFTLYVNNASSVTISNSSFTNSANSQASVYVYGGTNIMFTSDTISNNAGYGLKTFGAQQVTVTGSTFISNTYGVSIESSSKHVVVNGNTFTSNSIGVYIGSSSYNTVSSNDIVGSTSTTGGSIRLYINASYNTITNNTISNGASAGIYAYNQVNNNTIQSNNITGNAQQGIYLDTGESNNQIIGNYLYDNGSSGSYSSIQIHGYYNSDNVSNSVTNNTIIDTAGTGYAISLDNTQVISTYLSGNTFSGTGATAINDAGSNTIWGNQLDGKGNAINKGTNALTIGTSTVSGTLSLQGGMTTTQLSAPQAPTISKVGTAGTSSYSYVITALDGTGETVGSTAGSISNGNATLNATNYNTITWGRISGATSYKVYRTTSGGSPATTGLIGTVAATAGTVGSVTVFNDGSIMSFNDTGLSASGSVPTVNTTGGATLAGLLQGSKGVNAPSLDSISGALTIGAANASSISIGKTTSNVATTVNGTLVVKPITDSTTALQVQNASGTAVFNVSTTDGTVTIQGTNAARTNVIVKAATGQYAGQMMSFQGATGTDYADLGADAANNLVFGVGAIGSSVTSGYRNIGFGNYAIGSVTSGHDNIGIGSSSLVRVQDGASNVALGGGTLQYAVSSLNNTALGDNVLSVATGSGNTAAGASALSSTSTGIQNVALGQYAGYRNTTGANNTFLGTGAGNCHFTGQFCTSPAIQGSSAIGYEAQVQASDSIVLGSVDDPVNVGIGTTVPLNTFSVSPVAYTTGTASQSGTTVTGSGTAWTSSMVGSELVFSNGDHGVVTAVASGTSLTLTTSQTEASQAYRIHYAGLNVTSGGNVGIGTTNPGSNALSIVGVTQIQNSAGSALFTADTANMTVTIAKLVTGDITVNGHVVTGGTTPTIAAGAAACTTPTVSITGNDTAGTITVTTGTGCASAGTLATITFNKAFGTAPRIMLTPKTAASAALGSFNGTSGTTSFTLDSSSTATNTTTYTFNYLAIQ